MLNVRLPIACGMLRRDHNAPVVPGTMTLRIPKSMTLDIALAHMPSHRSMRIDGPAFRGRPLGHNFDPLRSELNPMLPTEFVELVDGLLQETLPCNKRERR